MMISLRAMAGDLSRARQAVNAAWNALTIR
jgi:hypothetical protein